MQVYLFGVEDFPTDLAGRYDSVVASGVWLEDHIPARGFEDIHALLKPNGFFVTAMRSIYYVNGQSEGYKDKLDQMIEDGRFRLVSVEEFKRGHTDVSVGMFKEMSSTLLVLQKLN